MLRGPAKSVAVAVAALLCAAAATAAIAEGVGLRVNLTPSLPRGLYIADDAGPLAEFCQAGSSDYVGRGRCRDGSAPLLKPIVAAEGQTVVLTADGITVDGRLLPNTAPSLFDRNGRLLRHYPFGRYKVGEGEVWVASSHHAGSFDSRYFGPIGEAEIRRRLVPLMTSEVTR
jgi:conjugative transfer signal peptidase TraF